MRGPMYKVVDDAERIRSPRRINRKPNRWDKIATLLNQDKTVFVEYRWPQGIMDNLKRRGLIVKASRRVGGYIVWRKEDTK